MPEQKKRGRHARRTTVTPLDGDVGMGLGRWRVTFATFDRPTNSAVVVGRRKALDIAHDFERSKARARWIEQRGRVHGIARVDFHIDDITPNLDRFDEAISEALAPLRVAPAGRFELDPPLKPEEVDIIRGYLRSANGLG